MSVSTVAGVNVNVPDAALDGVALFSGYSVEATIGVSGTVVSMLNSHHDDGADVPVPSYALTRHM